MRICRRVPGAGRDADLEVTHARRHELGWLGVRLSARMWQPSESRESLGFDRAQQFLGVFDVATCRDELCIGEPEATDATVVELAHLLHHLLHRVGRTCSPPPRCRRSNNSCEGSRVWSERPHRSRRPRDTNRAEARSKRCSRNCRPFWVDFPAVRGSTQAVALLRPQNNVLRPGSHPESTSRAEAPPRRWRRSCPSAATYLTAHRTR